MLSLILDIIIFITRAALRKKLIQWLKILVKKINVNLESHLQLMATHF